MIRDAKGRYVGVDQYDNYHNGKEPDMDALHADGRVRRRWNVNDWTPGDYTYDESIDALRLTWDGSIIWKYTHN